MTQKNIYKKKLEFYRSKLTGDIEYKPPSRNLDEFLGFLKMKNDFKIEKLNINNFIPRYSVLKCTDWLIIISIYLSFALGYMDWCYTQAKKPRLI